jgi:hypothetical protein
MKIIPDTNKKFRREIFAALNTYFSSCVLRNSGVFAPIFLKINFAGLKLILSYDKLSSHIIT